MYKVHLIALHSPNVMFPDFDQLHITQVKFVSCTVQIFYVVMAILSASSITFGGKHANISFMAVDFYVFPLCYVDS